MSVQPHHSFCRYPFPFTASTQSSKPNIPVPMRLSIRNLALNNRDSRKLVLEVKEKLEKDHFNLPVGRNGRDDEIMILWYLKDRKFSVKDTVSKLTKAIRWRREFGVSELSEQSMKNIAETGKAYVHDHLDVYGRPVLIVDASKHIPGMQDPYDDERLCVFLIEKALTRLPDGKEEVLGIVDLGRFVTENADIKFLMFLFDVFYYYYPRRLGQVLFVDAPLIYMPVWHLGKPFLKSYASLYIQGANLNSSQVSMTAPVLTSIVPGAGPLDASAYYVRFYLPLKFQATPPLPLPELNLEPYSWPSRCIAVRKFSGFARDGNIVEEAEKLAVSLSRSPWAKATSKSIDALLNRTV